VNLWLGNTASTVTVERVKKMTQAKAIKATATKATVQVAELQHNGTEISYADIWNFVQKHAGGNLHNVQIVPLGNVQLDSESPVPFGYNGKRGGVRETIQNWMLNGVDGDCSLATVLGKAKPLGHSPAKSPCACTHCSTAGTRLAPRCGALATSNW
jgi:hypothetical protein